MSPSNDSTNRNSARGLVRRPSARAFGPCFTREHGQRASVRAGIGVGKRIDGELIVEQTIAPALGCGEADAFFAGKRVAALERRANRLGIDVAHQPPDELHLASARLVLGDRTGLRDRLGEELRKFERCKPRRLESDELLAEVLQRLHVLLAARLRRRCGRPRRRPGIVWVERAIGRGGHAGSAGKMRLLS